MFTWLKGRMLRTVEYDTSFWRNGVTGLFIAASLAAAITAGGMPTGWGYILDLLLFVTLNTILFMTVTLFVAFLFSILYVPIPRWFATSFLYTGTLTYGILSEANLGLVFSIIIAVVYALFGVFLGGLLHMFRTVQKPVLKLAIALFPFLLVWAISVLPYPVDDVQQTLAHHVGLESTNEETGSVVNTLPIENPAEPGPYDVTYFTYGNGIDNHRSEFGDDIDIRSKSVDASEYINESEWPPSRERFWGFDETALPLNGRVWMPVGEGPFPLVLITHGNHLMEHFSDAGYAYLGERLASRGFIAVSVDQNFLNYSHWSNIPNENRKLRAWIFLHHLLQINQWERDRDTPFFQRVDVTNVALIGHSRGGQAAAMASDYTRWFEEDESLVGMEDVGIQAVVGLAPTDHSVDETRARLRDTYYLVLHGARDGDVNNYSGHRQYARTSFPNEPDRFKSAVYIAEANHSQFNTDWGRMDMRLPGGLFLNQANVMPAIQQQELTIGMIAAFLEAALHGNDTYVDLFRDVRVGRDWLPDTQYVTQFENGHFHVLTDFNRGDDEAQFHYNVRVETDGFRTWEIATAKDRRGNRKGNSGVVLEWEEFGTYTTHVSEEFRENMLLSTQIEADSGGAASTSQLEWSHFVFSMANMERDIEVEEEEMEEGFPPLDIDVEITFVGGLAVRRPLHEFMPIAAPIYTTYSRMPWMDAFLREGKYEEGMEPVFQTYALPINAFYESTNPEHPITATDVVSIALHFENGPGKVMLDDVGFMADPYESP